MNKQIFKEVTAVFDRVFYEKEHEAICAWYRQKYAERDSYLIFDGVVDPDNYAGILFLLKEAYSKDQKFGEYDLVADLAKNGPWGGWGHVAKWTSGLLRTDEHTIAPYRDMSKEEKNAMLRKIAVINVKKVDGKTSSDGSVHLKFAVNLVHYRLQRRCRGSVVEVDQRSGASVHEFYRLIDSYHVIPDIIDRIRSFRCGFILTAVCIRSRVSLRTAAGKSKGQNQHKADQNNKGSSVFHISIPIPFKY